MVCTSYNNKKIIVVGYGLDIKRNNISGQALMIDLFANIFNQRGFKVKRLLLNSLLKGNGKVGRHSWKRVLEYVWLLIKIITTLIAHVKSSVYLSPVSNKIGCIRDCIIILFAKLCGDKIFLQQFGNRFKDFYFELSPMQQSILLFCYKKANVITVEGEMMKIQYAELGIKENVEILRNGLSVNLGEKEKVPRSINMPIKLFFLNNMIETKGYLDVLEAVNILVNKNRLNIICTFAGKYMSAIDDVMFNSSEDSQKYFNDKIKTYGLNDRIKYFPSLYGNNKQREWDNTHFFLLPTYYIFEGQPTAIIEAMGHGVVPIVTRHGLISEIVDEKCGIFVEKQKPQQIADAIKKMIENPDKYESLSINAYNRYSKYHTIASYETHLLSIYNNHF